MNRAEVYEQLKTDHWDHVHNWAGIEAIIEKVSRYTDCSVDALREIMREIEAKHPKPKPKKRKTWRNIEFKKPCRTCGTVIGFARTEKGKMMPVNLNDKKAFNDLVNIERKAQDEKWGAQYHSDEKWLAIAVEELGELSQAILEGNEFDFIEEVVQLAAVIENWVTSRDFHDVTGDWIKYNNLGS